MKRKQVGHYEMISTVGEKCRAFVPQPLPPSPPVQIDGELRDLLDQAMIALGRLDGMATLLPDPSLFLYMYIRKEAVLSSQIEGTQSSLTDLLLFEEAEIPGVPVDDVQEVSNYVAALHYGLERLKKGMPLSLRLFREIHRVLLTKGRGSQKNPGEFRRSQNWIGGSRPGNARFVPPPPDKVIECMGALEKFLHDEPVKLPLLVKVALAHVQFETIHPFLDGNGRLGRLLITLILCEAKAMTVPMLYLSLYFKTHRQDYYDLLQKVRMEGDWETWLAFFLKGIIETSHQAVKTIQRLIKLFEEDRKKVELLGRASGSALRLLSYMQKHPVCSIMKAAEELALSVPTVTASLIHLQKIGIVKELTGKRRNRQFIYQRYIKILNEGTEPFSTNDG